MIFIFARAIQWKFAFTKFSSIVFWPFICTKWYVWCPRMAWYWMNYFVPMFGSDRALAFSITFIVLNQNIYSSGLLVCILCLLHWLIKTQYNSFSTILGSEERRETLWSPEEDWAYRNIRNNPWSWDSDTRRALFLLKDGPQMQKLCASWKARNLPRCNFKHASTLEETSDFESDYKDIFIGGG